MSFDIRLEAFSGPIDLLLFLVRRNEIDVSQITLSQVADQFLQYLEVLQEINIDSVGDFLDVASRLVEMKSRAVLPQIEPEESEASFADPRENLVERLLWYKEFRDAASLLDEQAASWQQRYPRLQDDIPVRETDLSEQPIKNIELWDLVSAFGRVLRDTVRAQPEKIYYDETPIQVHMQAIHRRLVDEGQAVFSELFQIGMHKSTMVGVFLAVLELTRHHNVRAEQPDIHGDILLVPGEGFQTELRISVIDNYDPHSLTPDLSENAISGLESSGTESAPSQEV